MVGDRQIVWEVTAVSVLEMLSCAAVGIALGVLAN
jgi:hypothetical protein